MKLAHILLWSWIANFVLYAFIASWLGGDAFNGHSSGGHYYLAMHGHLTEVSRTAFEYSLWHTYVLIAHFIVVGVVQWRSRKRLAAAA
jgi:hypothetical protein